MFPLLCVVCGLLVVVLVLVAIVFVDRGVLATRVDLLSEAVAREAELARTREFAELRHHGEVVKAIQCARLSPDLPELIRGGMGGLHKGIEALGMAIDGLPAAIVNREDAGGPLSTPHPPALGCARAPLPPPAPPPRRNAHTVAPGPEPGPAPAPAPRPVEKTLISFRLQPEEPEEPEEQEEQEETRQWRTKDLRVASAAVTTGLLAALTLGCSDPGPDPMADAGAWTCAALTEGCASCNTVYNSVGDPGTTPADLCPGTCSAWRWGQLQDCAFGPCSGSCGPGPTLVPDYVWDPGCEACLASQCDSAACKADK